jgi:hypothetical protein
VGEDSIFESTTTRPSWNFSAGLWHAQNQIFYQSILITSTSLNLFLPLRNRSARRQRSRHIDQRQLETQLQIKEYRFARCSCPHRLNRIAPAWMPPSKLAN